MDNSHEAVAREALEEFRWLHLYADRQLLKQGRLVAAARNLQARARHAQWAAFTLSAVLVVSAAANFVRFGDGGSVRHCIDGALVFSIAAGVALQAARVAARTQELVSIVERLLPSQVGAANEPVTA